MSLGRAKHGPEYHIQEALIEYLEDRGWYVKRMIGNAFQSGVPDLYCHHLEWRARWIDVKVEGRYTFTRQQKIEWPRMEKFGCGIWILTGANQEQYDRLFGPPNWRDYWKPQWDLPDIDGLLDQVKLDK